MIHLIHELLPWFLSAVTLLGIWLIGRTGTTRKGWMVGIVANITWIVFDVWWAAWGLVPLSAALVVMYSWQLWGRHLKAWIERRRHPLVTLPCHFCGGNHPPNGIGPSCLPVDEW